MAAVILSGCGEKHTTEMMPTEILQTTTVETTTANPTQEWIDTVYD